MLERQELYCHDCGHYVQFNIDTALDGNHVFKCPVCGHEHCRVVKNGEITDIRWDSRNGMTHQVSISTVTYSTQSTYAVTSSTSSTSVDVGGYLGQSWANSATTY